MNISQILTKLKSLVYSKSEADTLLSSKASSSHKHTKSEITDFPTIPTKTSQLSNDSGFLTSHQSLSNYSTLANTVKSLSISGKTITVTPGSGSAYTLTTQDTNTTYSNFVKSGSGAAAGLVPAPSTTAGTTKYLREDGTWQVPPDHTYTVNNATLTIQKNGSNVATFTANASSNATANITVPTNTNQLTNGAGFITSSGSCNYANSAGSAGSASSATYAGYVQGDKSTGLYVNSVKYGNALVTTNQSNFGAIWNAPTKNYRVACTTYPNANDDVYLCYSVTNANVRSSTNTVSRECVWNANDGTLRTANVKATGGLYYNSYRIYVG